MPSFWTSTAAACIVALLAASCNDANFAGDNKKSSPRKTPAKVPSATNDAVGSDGSSSDCIDQMLPVRVMIGIDNSFSMYEEIATLKTSIAELFDALKTIKPVGSDQPLNDISVGVFTFEDDPNNRHLYGPTADVSALKQDLQNVTVAKNAGNQDGPEEGFSAVLDMLKTLETQAGGKQIVPIVLMITDNFAHNGGALGSRDYSDTPITAKLAGDAYNHLFLYDSTPNYVPTDPLGSATAPAGQTIPSAQWDAIRAQWKSTRPTATRDPGQGFGFPFSSGTMLQSLPQDLASALKICK